MESKTAVERWPIGTRFVLKGIVFDSRALRQGECSIGSTL